LGAWFFPPSDEVIGEMAAAGRCHQPGEKSEGDRETKICPGFIRTFRGTARLHHLKMVESRSGAVTRRLRFQIPLIKPDMRLSLHQMWSTTFDALCGLCPYVALDS
jgi:hypothetical protein